MRALAPKPHRGDVIAAGAVVLTTLVAMLVARFDGVWPDAALLAVTALATAFVALLAVLAPMEGPHPRPYQSVLYVTALVLWLGTLTCLALTLGAERLDEPGVAAAIGTAVVAPAWWFATARRSAICTLIAAVASGVVAVALLAAIAGTDDPAPFRWLLLVLSGGFVLAAVDWRDRRPRHAAALVDAAGIAAAALAATFVLRDEGAGWGWELFLFAAGFGLAGYAAVDRHPGPGYLGVVVLALTVLVAARPATLLGWPLVLALGAGILLVVGLRPSRPLPPEPSGEPSEVIAFDERAPTPR